MRKTARSHLEESSLSGKNDITHDIFRILNRQIENASIVENFFLNHFFSFFFFNMGMV